jgi:4-hydroxybenzoate polyprenyltransferase
MLSWLFRVSRPRFWTYVFGPYLVGLAAHRDLALFAQPLTWLWALYFTLPANLLIYGINDIFDYETDVLNVKKTGYEAAVPPDERKKLWGAILLTGVPFFLAACFLSRPAQLVLGAFILLSVFYSAPPIRAKARPFLDAMFNFLYVCPGFVAYFLLGPKPFWPLIALAGWCWVMAMQLYSAVPDITADSASGIRTTATVLGLKEALVLCLALYLLAAALAYPAIGWLALPLGLVYALLMALSLRAGSEEGVMRLYRRFPLINTLCGMALFFRAAL